MTYVVRDENKTIAKAAGWDLVSITSHRGVFTHAATGRVVQLSAASLDNSGCYRPLPEDADVIAMLWANLVAQLKNAGFNSGPKSV